MVAELTLLALGQAVDPLDATTEIVDRVCSPILADAYGDRELTFSDFYFFEGISDDVFFAYDDCVVANDPFFDAVAGCDESAIEAIGNPTLTFAQFSELLYDEPFEAAVASCLDEAILVDQRVEEAAVVCDPRMEAVFRSVNVLDRTAVESRIGEVLSAYAECMRANGVDDYPDPSVGSVADGGLSVLTGAARSAVFLPSLESVAADIDRFSTTVSIAVPILVALLALVTWLAVGRALRPVEEIRFQVASIGAADLGRRVPEPPTGDEVGRLAATMNRMLDRLERSSGRQQQFVSDASHELRSPIASIRTQLEVAIAHPDRADWNDVAGGVLEESVRMERLVDDLLTLAKADEGVLVRRVGRVDMRELVLGELERVDHLVVDASGVGPGVVQGDSLGLRRVIRNLLENAARHASTTVRVTVAQGGPEVTVVVEDDGTGIDPGDRERVFERFTRLEEGRARGVGGAGLGLAVVSELAHAHDGSVAVGSSDLGGARFEVRLPAEI